jgi:hypothetical protein
MNYSSRFWLYAPITSFLIIAAAVMAYWWVTADAFEKKLAAMKDHTAVPGIRLDWDSVEVGGFPFRVDASFKNFRVLGRGAHGDFTWKTDKLALHALTYDRRKTVYEAGGAQRMDWTDAAGKHHLANLIAGSLRASSVQDDNGLRRFDMDGMNLVSQDFTLNRAREFTIARFQFHMRRSPNGKNPDLMLRAENWNGKKLVQAYATLSPGAPLMPLMAGNAVWPEAIAKWKAQGGHAEFTQASEAALAQAALSVLY